jgi:hypothetical protein
MDPDQTARMRRLVWIHAGSKPIMLVFIMTRLNFSLTLSLLAATDSTYATSADG